MQSQHRGHQASSHQHTPGGEPHGARPSPRLNDRSRESSSTSSTWNSRPHGITPGGQISFGLIRTAIANQAKKHLSAEERKLVCEAMCHDVSTADCFYTSVPEIGDVFRIRALRMKAMEHDESMEPDIQSTDNEAGLMAISDNDNEA
ncbi:hypothetical protein MHYP_G00252250 [Metynnis hypsauchen]